MKGAKQILLAGFAALCMVLPACRSTRSTFINNIEAPHLVVSAEPLNTASYIAEYAQDGALPFTCEVKLGTDGRIRRDYVWKDEKGTEKKVSIVINGRKAVRIENGKATPVNEVDTAQARFFSGLILNPDTVIANADRKKETVGFSAADGKQCYAYALDLVGIPDIESCLAAIDPETDRWSLLFVRMTNDSDTVFSSRFQEYKTESGVTYPSRIVSTTDEGAPSTCIIRDIKINPELPDELFRLSEPNG